MIVLKYPGYLLFFSPFTFFRCFHFVTDRIADGPESSGVEIQAPGLGGLDQVLHKGRLVCKLAARCRICTCYFWGRQVYVETKLDCGVYKYNVSAGKKKKIEEIYYFSYMTYLFPTIIVSKTYKYLHDYFHAPVKGW